MLISRDVVTKIEALADNLAAALAESEKTGLGASDGKQNDLKTSKEC